MRPTSAIHYTLCYAAVASLFGECQCHDVMSYPYLLHIDVRTGGYRCGCGFGRGCGYAIAAYNEWYAQTIAVKPTNGSNEPRTWAEVKLEDVEKEEMYIEGKDIALQEQQREMEQSQADEEETKDPLGLERIIVSNDRKSKFQAFRRMNIWKTTKKMKKNKSSTADGDGSEDEDDIEQKQTTRSGTHLIDTVIQKGSISTSSDDFNPYLFLTEVHHDTSIHKLELGLHTLQKAVNNRTDQMRQLVKDHFTQYVISKDTIDTIHLLLQSELQDTSQGRTARLKQLLDSINTQTSKLYEPLLQRKQESDRIRSVLDVLSRYRFLFDLPGSLKENIAKQQYDKVIRDYKKAKSVVVLNAKASTGVVDSKTDGNATSPTTENLGTHTISQRVLTEVEHIISDFRTSLFRRLDIATTPLEEQQRVIAWLVQLDCGTDPAWYYLKKQKEWICSMLDRAVDEMGDRMTSAYLRTRSSAGSGSIQGASRALSFGNDEFANVTGNMNSIDKFAGWNGERQGDPSPSSSRLVRTLCTILVRTMPDFFQLAQAIASGKFARPTNATPSWHVVSPSHDDRLPHDDRTRIKQLISEINRQFANYIRHSIITESIGKDEIVGYRTLPTHIGEQMHAAVKSYHAMKALAMPSEYLTDLKALNHEICVYYIEQLFRNTFITISQLHLSEDWILITTNEHNIQHRITSLPQQFKNAMIQAIQGVRAIPTVAMKSRWMIQLCAAPFLECVRAFIDTLHAAAFTSEKREETEQEEEEEEEGEDTIFQNQSIITTNYRDRRLLAVLSNLAYTSEIILPPLFTRFKSLLPAHTHTSMENEEDHIDSLIATLEKMIESAYIRFKIMGLSQPLAFGMFCAGVNWMDDSDLDLSHDDDEDDDETSRHHRSNSSTHMIRTPSTGLRSCILELILRLISIHHELYSILPREEDRKALLENIICDTCHALTVAIGHVMSDGISPKWALYVSCELDVLRDGLDHYMLDLTETSLDTCQSKLDTIIYSRYTSEECKRIRSHITSHVKSSMSIMMECFKPNVIHKRSVRKSVEDEEDEGEEED